MERAELEPSRARVQLARLLAGWGVLLGLAGTLAPSVCLQIVAVGYAAVFLAGLWFLVLRSVAAGDETTVVR